MMKRITLICAVMLALAASAAALDKAAIGSNDALAYLNVDIENNPGWVAGIKGGYQWKLFRKAGIEFASAGGDFVHNVSRNYTKGGAAASVSLGYNFGQRFPLTLGLVFGHGPAGKLESHTGFAAGGVQYNAYSHQRVNIYTFDISADYDFKNCSRWTPFIGLTGGLGFVSQHGHGNITNVATGAVYQGGFEKRKKVNAIVGARLGTKWQLNECVTFSLYGSYSHLGKVKAKTYEFAGPTAMVNARTRKITAHQLDIKFGVKISF